jgi:uncharacterized protein (TIGR04255 family)
MVQDPFGAETPAEVPLARAPLVRVIAQLRYPEILSVEKRDFVAPFQEAIRAEYPILRPESKVVIDEGVPAATIAWRFFDKSGNWRVSVTPHFLALETTSYTNRADFFARLGRLVAALQTHFNPALVDRLGVRYVNRITGDALAVIDQLFRPEVCGLLATNLGGRTVHTMSESMFEQGDARLLARWGLVPPDMTVDPSTIEPIAEKSFLLDLDMSTASSVPFDAGEIVACARRYAERIYMMFRWAVRPAFLERYGAAT